MKSFYLGAAIAALSFAPATAQAQIFPDYVDGNTLAGGLIGAGVGGAIGSNLAGGGVQDEGTAIGAALGGLVGANIANNRRGPSYGNGYGGGVLSGQSGRNLAGVGLGALAGGAMGSNLAGGGVQDEGTAIGALLGGAAGYALANRGRANRGYGASGYGYGGAPSYGGYGYTGYNHGGGYAGDYAAPYAPTYAPVYTAPSGQFVSRTYALPTTYIQPAPVYTQPTIISQPHTVYTSPVSSGLTYADSSLRLSGPPLVSRDYYRGVTYTEHAPIARAMHEIVRGECPAGTTPQYDGTCLEPGVISGHSTSSYSSGGTVTDSEWSWTTPSQTTYSHHVVTSPAPTTTHTWSQGSNCGVNAYEGRSGCGSSQSATYCYGDSSKRYDRHGHEIKSGKSCR